MDDPELKAMQGLVAALEPLEDDARQRVIVWVAHRYDLDIGRARKSARSAGTDGEAQSTDQSDAAEFASLGDLVAAADPKTNGQKALVAGYWLQTNEGLADLDGQRINSELKHLGHGISNITDALTELMRVKPALAIQTRKSGKSRQARKKYKITEAGKKQVQAMLQGEG